MSQSLSPTTPLPAALRAAISEQAPEGRVRKVVLDGRCYWVKRRETLGWRMWLQKGDAARSFERERDALHRFAEIGLPVAEIVDEGPDYFVTRDGGTPLSRLLKDESVAEEERIRAFSAAGRTLHDFHEHGATHGRPAPRDMLWDGERITFIDFERFHPGRRRKRAQAVDLLIFVFCAYAVAMTDRPEIEAAILSYCALDQSGIWDRARTMLRRLRWLEPIGEALARRRPRSREVVALPLTFHRFLTDASR